MFFNKKRFFFSYSQLALLLKNGISETPSFKRNSACSGYNPHKKGCYSGRCHIITTLGFTSGIGPHRALTQFALSAFENASMYPLT